MKITKKIAKSAYDYFHLTNFSQLGFLQKTRQTMLFQRTGFCLGRNETYELLAQFVASQSSF